MSCAGSPWHDLPENFSQWLSIYRQFRRWTLVRLCDRICLFKSVHDLFPNPRQ
ncbi:hypothetical protein D3P06_05960 [Paracoccus aestuarii]|uniref:Transposase n=1 Tax=Paracoccus aestuarii TaxID=453842 RepID=A0A418ZZ61_9RHOB|nr:hypothetical protein D3P06_05960 [Paracoccus aestuarii]